jgi:hypothetical protein
MADNKYITETKEIHHDSLRKYVNIAEGKLKKHGKVEKDFGRVRAFLETKSVVLSREECRPHEAYDADSLRQRVVSATILLTIDDLTIEMRLF